MKGKLLQWKESMTTFWNQRSKREKRIIFGTGIIAGLLIIGLIAVASFSTSKLVPLYSNLSIQETSQIKTELDSRGVQYELEDGGSTIMVLENQVDTLLVELAGQGIPDSGSIDYSFFSENSSFGITDNEFNIMKLDAMQSELANLITSIDGIKNAEVMINLPEETVFIGDDVGEASAAIVLETRPGYQFEENQIKALYHIVSKAVPNLQEDNIGIMNQYFEYFDLDSNIGYASQSTHTYQQTVKKDVERDIQRRLQQMLGAMVGFENVIVSVTTDIDFTQENRVEELVEPVDVENLEGLPVSLDSIQESYTGVSRDGGIAGSGEEDVANYPAGSVGGDGDYEIDRETINYEFNRIRREIVESPYKIRDLGIQVAVDNVRDFNDANIEYLSNQEQNMVEEGITSILNSIVLTSIDTSYGEFEPEEKVSIVFQEFTSNYSTETPAEPVIPIWLYFGAGILLVIIIILIILLRRAKQRTDEDKEWTEDAIPVSEVEVRDLLEEQESEEVVRRKQLEKIAKENPEDFAKLLRSWIGDD